MRSACVWCGVCVGMCVCVCGGGGGVITNCYCTSGRYRDRACMVKPDFSSVQNKNLITISQESIYHSF